MEKRGLFFSVDALIALLILLFVLLVIFPTKGVVRVETEVHQDLLNSLSVLKVGEINNSYVLGLINSSDITDLDNSLLEQIGEFYVTDIVKARTMASEVLGDLNLSGNVGIWYGSPDSSYKLIYSNNKTAYEDAEDIETARMILSGIQNGTSVTGFSARAFLSSDLLNKYYYLGGYVGDGNVTLSVPYVGNISTADLELVINNDFDLYVNGNLVGSYTGSIDDFTPVNYTIPVDDFTSGNTSVEFRGVGLHIAGGFLKIVYEAEVAFSQPDKYLFPGIEGLINLYDGFYVPGDLGGLEIFIHANSSEVPIFLNVGNVTLINRTTVGEELITINNATLSALFTNDGVSYGDLSQKTIPLRLGLTNVSFLGIAQDADVYSVTDLSGSMDDNCNPSSCEFSCSSCIGACGICDAKAGNLILADAILNSSGNRVGLSGYEKTAKEADFHELSTDDGSLENIINNVWDASGWTCICCGINRGILGFRDGTVVESRVSAGNDDAEECLSDNDMSRSSSDLELVSDTGTCSGGLQEVGIRFRNMNIPQGSPILYAYIEFERDETESGTTTLTLYAEDVDDASGFSNTDGDITDRVETSAGVVWSNLITWNVGSERHNTPDISPVIQEIVDRSGWTSGNSIVVLVNGTGQRTAESYNGESSNAPLLVVSYGPLGCGNGSVDSGEQCDDGNTVNGDGCSAVCKEEDVLRSMVVLSDGYANRRCSEQNTGNADDDAEQAACDAKINHNITVHAVGFGDNVDTATLEDIATCGGGDYFFADVEDLSEIYQQVANVIVAEYSEQTLEVAGDLYTKLFSDSYIEFDYIKTDVPSGLIVSLEDQFDDDVSGSFDVPGDVMILDVQISSYSGPRWTEYVGINNDVVYNLPDYGGDYIFLGDPYIVNVPVALVPSGSSNSVNLTTGVGSENSSAGSVFNKVIYTVVKNASSFSPIVASADGCNWSIQFESGEFVGANIPSEYSGSDLCFYNETVDGGAGGGEVANSNDAVQLAVLSLLEELDIQPNGKIDFLFSGQDLDVSLDQLEGIPFAWSSEVQARRWF